MITIRIATVEDASSIQKIYAPYVLNTTITFELEHRQSKKWQNVSAIL